MGFSRLMRAWGGRKCLVSSRWPSVFSSTIKLIWILKLKITFYGNMHAVGLQSVPDQTEWICVTYCLRKVFREIQPSWLVMELLCACYCNICSFWASVEGEVWSLWFWVYCSCLYSSPVHSSNMRFLCFCLIPFIFLSTPCTMVHKGYALVQQNHPWNIRWKTIALE